MISKAIMIVCAGASFALLAWGYASVEMLLQASLLIILGLVMVFGYSLRPWLASMGFVLAVVAVIVGFYYGVPGNILVISFLAAFIAWDLAEFSARLKLAAKIDSVEKMERSHWQRLGLVIVAGGGVILLTRFIHLRFNFETAAILVLAGVWGITLLINRLRRVE